MSRPARAHRRHKMAMLGLVVLVASILGSVFALMAAAGGAL